MSERKPDLPPDWIIVQHRANTPIDWSIQMLKIIEPYRQTMSPLPNGYAVREYMAFLPIVNADVLDAMLRTPQKIPSDWKRNAKGCIQFIFFWGTIYEDKDGDQFVRCLYYDLTAFSWRWRAHSLDAPMHAIYPSIIWKK